MCGCHDPGVFGHLCEDQPGQGMLDVHCQGRLWWGENLVEKLRMRWWR